MNFGHGSLVIYHKRKEGTWLASYSILLDKKYHKADIRPLWHSLVTHLLKMGINRCSRIRPHEDEQPPKLTQNLFKERSVTQIGRNGLWLFDGFYALGNELPWVSETLEMQTLLWNLVLKLFEHTTVRKNYISEQPVGFLVIHDT